MLNVWHIYLHLAYIYGKCRYICDTLSIWGWKGSLFLLGFFFGNVFLVSRSTRHYFSGWWFEIFLIFTPIWGRFPFWLIFFRWVETTNQFFRVNLNVFVRHLRAWHAHTVTEEPQHEFPACKSAAASSVASFWIPSVSWLCASSPTWWFQTPLESFFWCWKVIS